jgi:hypothetical protein
VSTPIRPRAVVHRGSVEAFGLLVAVEPIGGRAAVRRVLDAWRPGTRTWTTPYGLVVAWPEPRRARAADAPGALLVRLGPDARVLSAVPLMPSELEALAPAPGALVLVRGGEAVSEVLGAEVDPASWLDVGAVALEHAAPLARPVQQPVHVGETATEEGVERALRAPVGGAPAVRAGVVQALTGARREETDSLSRAREGRMGGWRFVAAMGSVVARVLFALFARAASGLAVHAAPPPSPFEAFGSRLARALRHLAAQALLRLHLAPWIGRWQAEYVAKMLDFFEQGDLESALRHAIPLRASQAENAGPALLPPRPRDTLALTAGAARATTAIHLVDDLYDELRRRYRSAFEKLDREGDVDRAAFVLAELLRATAEAVAYLEKHRRFALAAELAEARGLAPEYAVRLWFRAGQKHRAMALARRHDCFALAVERLEREDRSAGEALRLAWADWLATAGDYLGAARVARGLVSAGRLVRVWIDRAIEVGGATACAASVLQLELDPEAFDAVRARILATLDVAGPLAQPVRQALFQALRASTAPGAAVLARAAVRAALADPWHTPRSIVEDLVAKAGDASLRLHALRGPNVGLAPAAVPSMPLVHERALADASGLPIMDAALVAHGRLLVALGELGVRLVALDGRTLARFDVPASALVVSSRGDRALAVTRRDGALEVSRIDVVRRRVQRWGLVGADMFADGFDGGTWFVAQGSQILGLDATADGFEALWTTTLPDGAVSALHWSARWLLAVSDESDSAFTLSAFELPALILRHRRPIEGQLAGLGWSEAVGSEWRFRAIEPPTDSRIVFATSTPSDEPWADVRILLAEGHWCVRARRADSRFVVLAGRCIPGAEAVQSSVCVLEAPPGVRIGDHAVLVFDARGRLLVVSPSTGELVAEFAVRA